MTCSPENVEHHTRACIVLHNYLMEKNKDHYSGKGYGDHFKPNGALVKGRWREEESNFFKNIAPKSGMNFSYEAKDIRTSISNYFGSEEGSVPWQDQIVDYDGYDETA